MTNFIAQVLIIIINCTVTIYYFQYFGVSWSSAIPFFVGVQYLKNLLEFVKKNKDAPHKDI